MARVLAIDLGTSSVKVQICDDAGRPIGAAARPYPTLRPRPRHAEQDPEDWWRATVDAVRATTGAVDAGGAGIDAIGITGQMHGTVLMGDDQRPMTPAIIWSDQRSVADVAALERAVGTDHVMAIAGGPLATGYQAATVAWLAARRPDLLARCRTVLLPRDWLRTRLTGELATDPSDAGGTGLFDIRDRAWSAAMMAAAGVRADQLPPVLPSVTRTGGLLPAAAAALGLRGDIPVVAGAGDAQAAALGAAVTRPGALLVTLSTGTQALMPVSAIPDAVNPHGQTVCTAIDPGSGAGWARVAATLNTGSALHWAADALGFVDDRALLAAAAGVPAGARGILFVPYLGGERSPWFDAGARGSFIGLAGDQTRAELARAVVEGVTLAGSLAFSMVAGEEAPSPSHLTLAGGGASEPAWRQLVADVYGLPVRYHDVPDQSVRGAAILATAMVHHTDPIEVADAWQPAVTDEITPDPDRHALYRERRRLLGQAYLALRPIVEGLTHETLA